MKLPPRLVQEPAWVTYLFTSLILLPLAVSSVYSYIFLMPRVDLLWQTHGLSGERPDLLMQMSRLAFYHGRLLCGAVVVAIAVAEVFSDVWRRRLRKPVLYGVTALATLWVAMGILSLTTAALLVVPMEAQSQGVLKNAEPPRPLEPSSAGASEGR